MGTCKTAIWKQPVMIRSVLFLALVAVCLGQQVPEAAEQDPGKLFFGAFGTRTSIYITTSTIMRWATCTYSNPSDACSGKRRRREAVDIVDVDLNINSANIDSSLVQEKDLTNDKEGKLNFF